PALITTRILEQFVAQVVGLMILRRLRPQLHRPFRVWLYPLPCLVALAGWLFVYLSAGRLYVGLGLGTLAVGIVVFLLWSARRREWPFGGTDVPPADQDAGPGPASDPGSPWGDDLTRKGASGTSSSSSLTGIVPPLP